MPAKRVFLILAISSFVLIALVACSEEAVPTQEPVEFNPTAAAPVDRPGGVTQPPTATPTAPGDAGNISVGQVLFTSEGCSGCHSAGDDKVVGPGLKGIAARAGTRTSLGADAYIEQSIRDSNAFTVEGYAPIMPSFASMDDDKVKDLMAYLNSLN